MRNTQNNQVHLSEKHSESSFSESKVGLGYSDKSDLEVWSAFKLGDEAAFNFIYQKYMHSLYNYSYQLSKDQDIARNVIHTMFITIRKKRNRLSEVYNIKGYLLKIIYRLTMDDLAKKNKYNKNLEDKHDDEFFAIEISQETKMINMEVAEERRFLLNLALNKLPIRQRQAILLMYKEELSYKEIAEVMDLEHVKSARKLIYRAISSMKSLLTGKK